MQRGSLRRQQGITLVGLIVMLSLFGVFAVLGLKVVPTVIEFMSIKKAIVAAKAISSKDLDVVKDGDELDIIVAYQKKIPLIGPTWLLIDYSATTVKGVASKPAA
jgi:type II secretory pathway pseudopilin PulG